MAHLRQTSVASFASSLYLPVDPENRPTLDDDADTYPSSDELFGPDHEEGDDYTISSRRYLSSHSRYSSAFSHASHPPTPPRSTRSTMSLERPSSSLSLTPPQPRHSNIDSSSSCSPSAWANRPSVIRTMTSAELPSPPSTARSSNEAHMSASLDQHVADQGVPIEKFDQLALEHLEQDKALLQVLRKLDDQKLRIAQLTYALSRLRVLSNSACLSPPDSDAPIVAGSSSAIQPRRLGAVIPKPLIVQQSSKSASSAFGRSAILSPSTSSTGLSGPSQNEAVNQRRLAKQQLHEFALRRSTRPPPKRANSKPTPDVVKRRGWEWEGARGSPSMVAKETKPRTADAVGHPNVTVRRPKRTEVAAHMAKSPARPAPRPSMASTASPNTPPRLLSLFSSPSSITSRSPLTPTQSQISTPAFYDSPTTPVPSRKNKDKPLPPRPVSPTKPMRLARNMSFRYEIPPMPPPDQRTAHVTLVDRRTPPLPAEEVQHRLAATFAHFSKPQPQPYVPDDDGAPEHAESPRQVMPRAEPDYLEQMLHRKWVAQLDEHSHQARGGWKSPLRVMKQKIAGGLGIGVTRRGSRASFGDSSSDAHSTSLDTPGYVHGLGTVQEGGADSEQDSIGGGWVGVVDKAKKSKKKGGKEEVAGTPKPTKWRFSRLGSSSS